MTTALTEPYFAALEAVCAASVPIRPVSEVDRLAAEAAPAILLKHDVHDVRPDDLVRFAAREASLEIEATFLFMVPDHPRTAGSYGFEEQCSMMREVAAWGHEIGLHLDAYHLVSGHQERLADAVRAVLERFSERGVSVTIGNTHGNTKHPHRDVNGYGTAFDLFEETARHDDFPGLAAVPEESAELIRQHRTSLSNLGFRVWADLPVWTPDGFTATNYLTDNWITKREAFRLHVFEETRGAYYRSARQPPGSLNRSAEGQRLTVTSTAVSGLTSGTSEVTLDAGVFVDLLDDPAVLPLLLLAHPEFYA